METATDLSKVYYGHNYESNVSVQDENAVVHVFGDVTQRKKYSHVDLIHMVDGVDADAGAIVSGGRGYYLKVSSFSCIFNGLS